MSDHSCLDFFWLDYLDFRTLRVTNNTLKTVVQNKWSFAKQKLPDETLHICDNEITVSDPTKIANKFSNYLTNVARNPLKKARKNKQVSGLPEKSHWRKTKWVINILNRLVIATSRYLVIKNLVIFFECLPNWLKQLQKT